MHELAGGGYVLFFRYVERVFSAKRKPAAIIISCPRANRYPERLDKILKTDVLRYVCRKLDDLERR